MGAMAWKRTEMSAESTARTLRRSSIPRNQWPRPVHHAFFQRPVRRWCIRFSTENTTMKNSIISHPDRGPWGSNKWRGNCSGYVYKDLFEQLQPKVFIDPMVGSGTSVEVAREMQIEAYGLDLHSGFNCLRGDILEAVGKQADFVCSHPPYGSQILYSGPGGMWGSEPHPDDLSHCKDDQDFLEKMQYVLLNQRRATVPGGYYATIIGDYRRQGRYSSYQAHLIASMPSDELAGVLIKTQHNCVSDRKSYGRMALPLIAHEYVCIWRKAAAPILVLLSKMAEEQMARVEGTWKNIVKIVLKALGGTASLDRIYAAVQNRAPEKVAQNPNWAAKIRQTVNSHPDSFKSVERGVWALAA